MTSGSLSLVKSATQLRQFAAQLAEIVDLAVENDHETSVGGQHRLMAGGRKVDDGEPPVREAYATAIGNPRAFIIGPAMGEQIALRSSTPRSTAWSSRTSP